MRPRNGRDPGVCRSGDGRGKRAHLWVVRTAVPASDARPGGGSSGTQRPARTAEVPPGFAQSGGYAWGEAPARRVLATLTVAV